MATAPLRSPQFVRGSHVSRDNMVIYKDAFEELLVAHATSTRIYMY